MRLLSIFIEIFIPEDTVMGPYLFVNGALVDMKHTKLYISCLKDVMPVSFRSALFTSYILTIFKQ